MSIRISAGKGGDFYGMEPDVSVICDHDRLEDSGCNGVPEWVIEVVSSSRTATCHVQPVVWQTDGSQIDN